MQFILETPNRSVPVGPGTILSNLDFPFLSPKTSGDQIGSVIPNPSNPQSLSIVNQSSAPWVCVQPDETAISLTNSQMIELVDGMVIVVGKNHIQVRSNPDWVSPSQVWPPMYTPEYPNYAYQDDLNFLLKNDSGTGISATLPPQIKGFNWGAFFIPFWWSLSMRFFLGLLCIVPYVGIIMHFLLGFMGNEWAWQNRRWNSIDQFNKVQKIWMYWGLGWWLCIIGLYGLATLMLGHQ